MNYTNKHLCDVCGKSMTIYELGYMGKPITIKKTPKYRKIKKGTQILCHQHHEELLNTLGKNPNTL